MIALKIILVAFLAQQCLAQLQCANSRIIAEKGASGTITSPNYPQNLVIELGEAPTCFWEIEAPLGYAVRAAIRDFTLTDLDFDPDFYDDNACRAHLGLHDGDQKSGKLVVCFDNYRPQLITSGRIATFEITFDHGLRAETTFSMDYSIVPMTVSPGHCSCGIQEAKLADLTEEVASLRRKVEELIKKR